MEREAFRLLQGAEASWWYCGRRDAVEQVAKKYLTLSPARRVLDIGAGFGGMLSFLSRYGSVDAFEQEETAVESSRRRGYGRVMTEESELNAISDAYQLVGIFDVLEHVKDDEIFLQGLLRMMTSGGTCLLTVPAFPWLWSQHDIHHHHFRRYRRRELIEQLEQIGFKVEYASYWNAFLFLPAAVTRLLGRSGSSALQLPGWVDRVLRGVLFLETRFIPFIRYPFGTGIVVCFRKP